MTSVDDMAVRLTTPRPSHDSLGVSPEQLLGLGGDSAEDKAFLAIRMNDSTSYFFTWFCKHYRMKLQGTTQHCPICFETTNSSIELSCGHAFCRKCLVASAAKNFKSCALCRREQVLNPDELRAQFDERRMLNLAKRMRSLGRDVMLPSLRARPASSLALLGGRRDPWAASSAAAATPALPKIIISSSADSVGSSSSSASSSGLGHLLAGPWGDVGAMSASELRRRWEKNLHPEAGERFAFLQDVGDTRLPQLATRWRTLSQLASVGADAGDGSAEELHARLNNAASPRVSLLGKARADRAAIPFFAATMPEPLASDAEDVGALPASDLRRRWTTLVAVGKQAGADAGGASAVELKQRWQGAVSGSQGGAFFEEDVGAYALSDLRRRWQSLAAAGLPASSDAGALDSAAMKERYRGFFVSEAAAAASSKPQASLQEQWSHTAALGQLTPPSPDRRPELAERWRAAMAMTA